MPSLLHEALLAVLRDHPELLAPLVGLPADGWTLLPADLGQPLPTELRADLVFDNPLHDCVIVFDAQLRIDPDKLFSLPAYQANARLARRRKVIVVVFAGTPAVARWMRRPVPLGGGSVFQALAICPTELAALAPSADPHLAVFAALGLSRTKHAKRAARDAIRALHSLDTATYRDYLTYILGAAQPAVRRALEAEMAKSNFPTPEIFKVLEERVKDHVRQEGRQEGLEQGVHKGLLMAARAVLQHRFGALPAATSDRLDAAGPEQLERWTVQAATAPTLDAALGDG